MENCGNSRACPKCHSETYNTRSIIQEENYAYRIVECHNCGFIFMLNPRSGTTHAHGVSPRYEGKSAPLRRHVVMCNLLCEMDDQKRIAEIGAGHGQLGLLLEKNGFEYVGYEPNEERASYCQALGINVISELFEPAAQSYDCVIMDNVLEHVLDPASLLKNAYSSLREKGRLLIVVPNVNDVRRFYPKWKEKNHYIRSHINYFSYESLRSMLHECGFVCAPFPFRSTRSTRLVFRGTALFWKARFFLSGLYVYGIRPADK